MRKINLRKLVLLPILLIIFFGFSFQDGPNRNNRTSTSENTQTIKNFEEPLTDLDSSTWIAQNSGTTNALYTVSAVSEMIGWAAGVGPTVVRTSNGGTSWINATGTGITGDIFNIYATSSNDAFCTTSPGATFIYKTTNGGTTWSQVYTLAGGFINCIQMISPANGYAVGDPVGGKWTVLKTTDGGNSWERMPTEPVQVGSELGWNNSFQILGNNMWFGTNSAKVYHSTNLGLTWTSSSTTGTQNSYAVHFNSMTFGIAGGDSLVKTTNGGANFSATNSPGNTGSFNGIEGNGVDYWSIRGMSVYHSNNLSTNWTTEFIQPGALFLDIDFQFSNGIPHGWVVGNTGAIYQIYTPPYINWGFNGGYHWSGSDYSTTAAPSQPMFCWEDEPGMKLVNNGVNRFPGGRVFNGNLDNGRWKISIAGTSKKIRFYGQNYTTIYISTNGFISFADFGGTVYTHPSGYGLPNNLQPLNALFPLFKDFDFRKTTTGADKSSISVIRTNNNIVITYLRAPEKNNTGNYVSFQVIIETFSGTPTANSRIVFQYAADETFFNSPSTLTTEPIFSDLFIPSPVGDPDNHLVGIQQMPNAFMYKSSHLITPYFPKPHLYRQIFDFDSPDHGFALEFGPDDTQLNYNCNTVVIPPPFILDISNINKNTSHSVFFRNPFTPFAIIGQSTNDPGLVLDGSGIYSFCSNFTGTPLQNGQSYYIEVKSPNTISTWSAAPVLYSGDTSGYNFTTAISQAYGNNMSIVDSLATFYSGDVNQDAVIDLSDILDIFNDASNFTNGNAVTDLDGNEIVDLTDMLISFNNASNFVQVKRP